MARRTPLSSCGQAVCLALGELVAQPAQGSARGVAGLAPWKIVVAAELFQFRVIAELPVCKGNERKVVPGVGEEVDDGWVGGRLGAGRQGLPLGRGAVLGCRFREVHYEL